MLKRTILLLCAVLILMAPPVGATWSIVLVDTATGEVAVASATCLSGIFLKNLLAVVVPGKGAGAAQSMVDNTGKNRIKIWNGLKAGLPSAQIILNTQQGDLFWKQRQYGVASLLPDAAGFTGGGAGIYKEDITGSVGTIHYAIQGNVLTGAPVIALAEQALVNTPGPVHARIMAAMQAARLAGGDGRCSCAPNDPTGCGSPPAGFDPTVDKSAHVGFIVVARTGDPEGKCIPAQGCANGKYWMNMNVIGTATSPDPVIRLQEKYDQFLLDRAGRPDGLLSPWTLDDAEVLGDGVSTRQLDVVLADLNGDPILAGGALWTVEHAEGSAGLSSLAGVIDHGNGSYTLTLAAGAGTGTDHLLVRVDDGVLTATLFPLPELVHRQALLGLDASVSASLGGSVTFDLMGPSALAGRPFTLSLSEAGSVPGQTTPKGVNIPLNMGRLFLASPHLADQHVLMGVPGVLGDTGRASVILRLPPGLFAPLADMPIWAAAYTLFPVDFASNAVELRVRE